MGVTDGISVLVKAVTIAKIVYSQGQEEKETNEKKKKCRGPGVQGLVNFLILFNFISINDVCANRFLFRPPPEVSLCTVFSATVQTEELLRLSPARSQNFQKRRIKITIIY